jgi:hypothetical protein
MISKFDYIPFSAFFYHGTNQGRRSFSAAKYNKEHYALGDDMNKRMKVQENDLSQLQTALEGLLLPSSSHTDRYYNLNLRKSAMCFSSTFPFLTFHAPQFFFRRTTSSLGAANASGVNLVGPKLTKELSLRLDASAMEACKFDDNNVEPKVPFTPIIRCLIERYSAFPQHQSAWPFLHKELDGDISSHPAHPDKYAAFTFHIEGHEQVRVSVTILTSKSGQKYMQFTHRTVTVVPTREMGNPTLCLFRRILSLS